MNNYINDLKIKEISSQLNRAETQKHKLIKNIFKGYEAYLKLVRSLLVASVEKGIHEIYSDNLIKKTNPIYEKLTSIFAKINLDIDSQLPLITIEQLKIRELGGNLIEEKNLENLKISEESNIYQKGNLVFEEEFNSQETIQFHCNENMFNASEYYHPSINDKACSIDLDISDKSIYDSDSSIKIVEKISLEKRFISSLMELMTEEDDIPESNNFENLNTSERKPFLKTII